MKTHYSLDELSAMSLPSLPGTRRGVAGYVERNGWAFVEVPGRGGPGGVRREYLPPAPVLQEIQQIEIGSLLKKSAPIAAKTEVTTVAAPSRAAAPATDRQRQIAEARAGILVAIDNIKIALKLSQQKAILEIIARAKAGTLPAHLASLIGIANAKSTENRTLSVRTVKNWIAASKTGATPAAAVATLAPKVPQPSTDIPAWATDLLAAYQQPQKPSLRWAVQQVCGAYGLEENVMYGRARRFLDKVGNVELEHGRRGSRAIKDLKPFVRRDFESLLPCDVYSADGHKFDAEIAHPSHGGPFRPEITSVIDIATRKIVGYSVDLAESGLCVLDAIRHSVETHGDFAIFYVDNGPGFDNALLSAPGVGMAVRVGFSVEHSLPYNSQARGVIERLHQMWVSAAKELATYIGKPMDAQASNKVHKITRRDIKLHGSSKLLMTFGQFITFCNQHIDAYNARPHRGLPMTVDAQTGKRRHMSPTEAWAAKAPKAEICKISHEDSRDLFRPRKEVKVARGEITLFRNRYFSKDLTEFHGDIVHAAYDVQDANNILVYTAEGRFICEAKWDANKVDYFPKSVIEQKREERAKARLRRNDAKRDEINDELAGMQPKDITPMALEDAPSPILEPVSTVALGAVALPEAVAVLPVATAPVRPMFELDTERYRWLMQNPTELDEDDWQWLREFVKTELYADMRDVFAREGIAWQQRQQTAI